MMAGTLEVTEELCWMPAGWVFDTVLERMAAVLHSQEPALAERLLAARTEASGGYLDLRDEVVAYHTPIEAESITTLRIAG